MDDYKNSSVFDKENNTKEKDTNINDVNIVRETDNNNQEKNKTEKVKRTIYDENAPYDNTSVGVAGWLFGPIAGAILSYISLKNLGNQYAKYILLGGILGTILIGYLLMFVIPETSNFQIGFLWLIFMFFQQKQVKKWGEDNPDKKYKSGFKALGWGILGGILLFVIFFITAMVFSPSTKVIEENITISKDYPREVNVGDTFNIKFSISNIDNIDHKLKTIDISNDLFKGISILDITPKSINENDDIFGTYIYNFDENLSNYSDSSIILNVKATNKGDFGGYVDFCIDSDTTCLYDGIRILVK